MFRKLGNTRDVSSRTLQISIKRDIDSYLQEGPVKAQLQEARTQLITALALYKAVRVEDGNNSKYIYPTYLSERQTKLSDIVGDLQDKDDGSVSMWNLLAGAQEINTQNLLNILLRLSDILQPMDGFPPLKKASQTNIKNAIVLVFETMRKAQLFPDKSLHVSIQLIVALARSIDKEVLQHLLCQYPNLIKELHDSGCKKSLQLVDGLFEEIESLYKKLFPAQAQATQFSNSFGAALAYSFQLFQSAANSLSFSTSNSASPLEKKSETTDKIYTGPTSNI